MFTPLDILYIVLAFCALWLTAAIFWLVWQVANILKSVNETMALGREAIEKIEEAVSAIREKFEHATSSLPLIVGGLKKLVDYAIEKRRTGKEDENTR